jgi:hypothetical protein
MGQPNPVPWQTIAVGDDRLLVVTTSSEGARHRLWARHRPWVGVTPTSSIEERLVGRLPGRWAGWLLDGGYRRLLELQDAARWSYITSALCRSTATLPPRALHRIHAQPGRVLGGSIFRTTI